MQQLQHNLRLPCQLGLRTLLKDGRLRTLPQFDHRCVSSALFKTSVKGEPVFDSSKVNKLWYYPPQPSLIPNQRPSVARYFAQKLLLWMPRKMWQVHIRSVKKPFDKYGHLFSRTSSTRYRRVLQLSI